MIQVLLLENDNLKINGQIYGRRFGLTTISNFIDLRAGKIIYATEGRSKKEVEPFTKLLA